MRGCVSGHEEGVAGWSQCHGSAFFLEMIQRDIFASYKRVDVLDAPVAPDLHRGPGITRRT